jgi:hypothetical protein
MQIQLEDDTATLHDPHTLLNGFFTTSTSKTPYLSHLLPYDPYSKAQARLESGLKEYLLLLLLAEQAAVGLIDKAYASFDPLVGENACQIRALVNCLIFTHYQPDGNRLLEQVRETKLRVGELLDSLPKLELSGRSLGQILKDSKVDLSLTSIEIYLIESYLLTIVKINKPPKAGLEFIKNEYTDTKKIKAIQPVGTMFAESLIKNVRESLSLYSVSFIQKLSYNLASPYLHNLIKTKLYRRHNRLHCVSCYWATKLVMAQALLGQVSIVVISRQLAKDQHYKVIAEFASIYKPAQNRYLPAELEDVDLSKPALYLLINGCRKTHEFPSIADWKQELEGFDLIDLILSYAASHRQYPGLENTTIAEIDDSEYEGYKQKASEWGCSIDNPSLFFLSHAFCDSLYHIPKHLTLSSSISVQY